MAWWLSARRALLGALAVGMLVLIAEAAGGAPARPVLARFSGRAWGVLGSRGSFDGPSVFAAVGGDNTLELRSAATGQVVEELGRVGQSWTNNGFAFSPDGRDVYLTVVPKARRWKSLLLEQVSVSTHRWRLIGRGEQPAVNPDGRLLAWASGEGRSATIVVEDRATGDRSQINISRLLGSNTDLLNASLGWLGSGDQLAVFEWCCAVAARAPATGDRSGAPGHRSGQATFHLVLVSFGRGGGLTARRVHLPRGSEIPESVGSDVTHPNSVLVSWLGPGDRATIDRLRIAGSEATLTPVLTVAQAQVLSFDPLGRRVLYIQGHSPPNLWTARIGQGQPSAARELIHKSNLDPVAW